MQRRPSNRFLRALGLIPFGLAFVGLGTETVAQAQAPSEDVEISVESAPTTQAQAPDQVATLKSQVDALEKRLAETQAQIQVAADAQAQAVLDAKAEREVERRAQREAEEQRKKEDLLSRIAKYGVHISGYAQVQYGRNEMSQDELQQGGTALNQDKFAVRRGRLRVNGRWRYFHTDFELDGSNTRGPSTSVRRASISGVLPGLHEDDPPLLLLTAGLTEIPLGLELQQGQDDILFLERTTGSLAFFPGPVDTGVKLEAAYSVFRLQLAVMNGVPLDDRSNVGGVDFVSAPDYVGRLGVDAKPHEKFHVKGGASFLTGKGFHAGSDATKSVLQWDDANGDGRATITEYKPTSARGAIPSSTFDRWAVGADLSLDLQTKIGSTRVYGEVLLASNLDRGLYVADPTFVGRDIRELAWYVAAIQDISEYGFVGARYEVYDPDSDLVDSRRGRVFARDSEIKTFSPIVGVRIPGIARLTFQYDLVKDHLGRDSRGLPTDIANNQWTLRAQGRF